MLSSALQGAVPVKVHLTKVEADHSTRFLLTFTDISSEVAAQKELEQQSRRLELASEGGGVGIRREDQTGIFEAFQRGDTQADGTGLGLHISRNYARQMFHGDLTYRDNSPHGAIFTLTAEFPRTSLPLEETERAAAQIEASDILKGKRVLFAEDSPVLRMTTKKQLEIQGAIVLVAEDGRQALAIAELSTT